MSEEKINAFIKDYAPIAQLIPLTTDEIREQGRDYNPHEWDKNIDRLLKYSDIKFYKRDRSESPYEYDEYFAVFSNINGVKTLHRVAYSACMNATPWVEISIDEDNVLHYMRRSARFKRDAETSESLANMSKKWGCLYTTAY